MQVLCLKVPLVPPGNLKIDTMCRYQTLHRQRGRSLSGTKVVVFGQEIAECRKISERGAIATIKRWLPMLTALAYA